MINVIGLGCKSGHLTVDGLNVLGACGNVFVKTAQTDTYSYFLESNIAHTTLDFIYDNAENFDCLDNDICEFLLQQEKKLGVVCYCVNGNGKQDRSVILLSKLTQIKIYPTVSYCDFYNSPNLATVTISAYELVGLKGFNYDTRTSLVITEIDNNFIASEIKLILSDMIGDEEDIKFGDKIIKVFELDRQKNYDYSCTLCVAPLELTRKKRYNFMDLYLLMRILRGDHGCDWDKAQTHESIRANAIEEAYELVEAINNLDIDNLVEEIGDVMLQSVFHCIIGEDFGEFNTTDAVSHLCNKLITRHTHIFGDVVANNANEALKAWENAKTKEKKYNSIIDKIDGLAKSLPTLMRAKKVQNIAKKANMDFENFSQVVDKINEELNEFITASQDDKEMEAGDLLFSVVNALRWQNIEPDIALDKSIEKFAKRLQRVTNKCDCDMQCKSPQELDKLWEEAKLED